VKRSRTLLAWEYAHNMLGSQRAHVFVWVPIHLYLCYYVLVPLLVLHTQISLVRTEASPWVSRSQVAVQDCVSGGFRQGSAIPVPHSRVDYMIGRVAGHRAQVQAQVLQLCQVSC
jgi:hypothetical protein